MNIERRATRNVKAIALLESLEPRQLLSGIVAGGATHHGRAAIAQRQVIQYLLPSQPITGTPIPPGFKLPVLNTGGTTISAGTLYLGVTNSKLILTPASFSGVDGSVTLTDLSTVLNNFGQTPLNGTFQGTPINLTDLNDVLNNFGNASTTTSGSTSTDDGDGAIQGGLTVATATTGTLDLGGTLTIAGAPNPSTFNLGNITLTGGTLTLGSGTLDLTNNKLIVKTAPYNNSTTISLLLNADGTLTSTDTPTFSLVGPSSTNIPFSGGAASLGRSTYTIDLTNAKQISLEVNTAEQLSGGTVTVNAGGATIDTGSGTPGAL